MLSESITPIIDLFTIQIKKSPVSAVLAAIIITTLFGEYWPQLQLEPVVIKIHPTKIYNSYSPANALKIKTTVQRIGIDIKSITLFDPIIKIELPVALELVDQDLNPPLQCSIDDNTLGSDRKIYNYNCSSLGPDQSIELTFTSIEEVEKRATVKVRVEGRSKNGTLFVETALGSIWAL